jgi:peptidoglycan/xylan/chitin deacetylase (PgdA/CDA1 family)
MTKWLDPLRARLDAAPRPVQFFFRDDDVGWGDERLWALLDRFSGPARPIDLAVIPALLNRPLVGALRRRMERSNHDLALHQHGWAHANHEPCGRRSEFGPSRSIAEMRADLRRGRAAMSAAFGPASSVVFVPPWNRCSEVTAAVLRDEGVRALSRDATAEPFGLHGLAEIPVTVDWLAKRKGGGRVAAEERAQLLATAASGARPVGVMLHHAVMTDDDLAELDELLGVLDTHPGAVLTSMTALVP